MFEDYKEHLKSLLKFMVANGYTLKPYPKIVLNNKKQDGLFITTGYYNPETMTVTVFTNQRHEKDVLRSAAHEFIHHKQNVEGRLGKDAYSSDKITEDEKLIGLEREAYMYGNLAFRSWTEYEQKKQ